MSDTRKDKREQKEYNRALKSKRAPKMEPYNRRKACSK